MKLIFTAKDRFEAEIVSGILKENGIHSLIKYDDQGGQMPAMTFGQGLPILISEIDWDDGLSALDKNGIKN